MQTLTSHRFAAGPSSRVKTGEGLVVAAAALLLAAAAPEEPRPQVMLMTGLPLVWGEKGPFDRDARPTAAYADLRGEFDFRLVDVLDEATLDRGRLLFLVQPKRLAPAELEALDAWIRAGGRALILTDPFLAWPSALPPGDIRRPPPVGLLAPLLDHWRIRLEGPPEPVVLDSVAEGRRIRFGTPGSFRSFSPDCVVEPEGWKARCRLGRGAATLIADADLMRDSLWESGEAENPAVVAGWLDELAGIDRSRPRAGSAGEGWIRIAALALALLAAVGGIGLLLRRRRAR